MPGPCTGLLVLDCSWGMPGGLAGLVLADYGAEVIKVEPPTGDPWRTHPAWRFWNRGKQSVVLDLKTAEGRANAHALAARADVVLEAFRPGVAQRLGIDYDTLRGINPRLVYCSLSSFGQDGPLRNVKGYEAVITARAGRMMAFRGQPDRDGPVYVAVPTISWASSQIAVHGILAALRVRERTARGQWVQTSMLQGLMPYDLQSLVIHRLTQRDPVRWPGDPWSTPNVSPRWSTCPSAARTAAGFRWATTSCACFNLSSVLLASGTSTVTRASRTHRPSRLRTGSCSVT